MCIMDDMEMGDNMNRFIKGYLAGVFTILLVMAVGNGGFADSVLKNITAQVDTAMKVVANGKPFLLKDEGGAVTKPILYKGTYYIPAKSTAAAVGMAYDLDLKKKTITIGERSAFVFVDANMYRDSNGTIFTKDPVKARFGDKVFKSAIVSSMPLETSGSLLGNIRLNGKYTTFAATVCLSGMAENAQVLHFLDKNTREVIESITILPGEILEVAFSVAGVVDLSVASDADQGAKEFIVVGDPRLK